MEEICRLNTENILGMVKSKGAVKILIAIDLLLFNGNFVAFEEKGEHHMIKG